MLRRLEDSGLDLPPTIEDAEVSRIKSSGLGSSHTTPCGAAVPARPPTRSSETTHLSRGPQWDSGATRRGTWV